MDAIRPELHARLIRFWEAKGVALCAEAQGDGVPCTALGRDCETCAMAVRALRDAWPADTALPPHLDDLE